MKQLEEIKEREKKSLRLFPLNHDVETTRMSYCGAFTLPGNRWPAPLSRCVIKCLNVMLSLQILCAIITSCLCGIISGCMLVRSGYQYSIPGTDRASTENCS